MFETLFSYPGVIGRHQDGPLATERSAYLLLSHAVHPREA